MKKTIGNITIEIKGTLITFVDATTREMIKAVDSNPVEALGKYHQHGHRSIHYSVPMVEYQRQRIG